MSSEMYCCSSCGKVFKLAGPGKKAKCPNCSQILLDMGIVEEDYARLDKQKREELKKRTNEDSVKPTIKTTKPEQTVKPDSLTKDNKNDQKISYTTDNELNPLFDVGDVEPSDALDHSGSSIAPEKSVALNTNTRRSSFFDMDMSTTADSNSQSNSIFESHGETKEETSPIINNSEKRTKQEKNPHQKERKKGKTGIIVLACIVGVLVLVVGGLAAYLFLLLKPQNINIADVKLPKIGTSEEAQAVIDHINSIGEVELDDEPIIAECEDSYIALTPEQQAEVSNFNALVDARQKLDELIASKPIPFSDANWETTQEELIAMLGKPDEEGDNENYGHGLWYYNVKNEGFTGIAKYNFQNGKLTRCFFTIESYDENAIKHFETLFSTKYGTPNYSDDYGNMRWDTESVSCGIMKVKLFGGLVNILYMKPGLGG